MQARKKQDMHYFTRMPFTSLKLLRYFQVCTSYIMIYLPKRATHQQWAIFSPDIRAMPLEKLIRIDKAEEGEEVTKMLATKRKNLKNSNHQSPTTMQRCGKYHNCKN